MSALGTDIEFVKSSDDPENVYISQDRPHYFCMRTYDLLGRQPIERVALYKSLLSTGTDQILRNFFCGKNKYSLKHAAAVHQYRLKSAFQPRE